MRLGQAPDTRLNPFKRFQRLGVSFAMKNRGDGLNMLLELGFGFGIHGKYGSLNDGAILTLTLPSRHKQIYSSPN